MGFQIEDGTGKGYRSKVSNEGALQIRGEVHHIQYQFSKNYGQAYQLLSTYSIGASGTNVLQYIKNLSSTLLLCVTYVRLQGVGIPNLPNSLNIYFHIRKLHITS